MSLATTMVLLGLMGAGPSDRLVVPPDLQVELLSKVLRYDRTYAGRAGERARVLVVHAPGAPESLRVAREFLAALELLPRLGGVAHDDRLYAFTSEEALAADVKALRPSVVVFAPDFSGKAAALGARFEGCDCLTVSTTPDGVRDGLVLGFDLVSGKPRMLFNLTHARRQGTDFRAELLSLMTVYP